MKIALLSIVGAFRSGKSFLLNFIIKYLKELSNGNENYTFNKNDKIEGCCNNENENINGFKWKNSKYGVTNGIWIYNKPFIIPNPKNSKEKIAILIMDTQVYLLYIKGLFDNNFNEKMNVSIFGLSTLLCSYEIFNIKERVNEKDLDYLELYCEYGKECINNNNNEIKPFEKIEFLIRDYPNFEDKNDIKKCIKEMNIYFNELFERKNDVELNNKRNNIKSIFKSIFYYLLPHPGLEITEKNYNGEISKINNSFLNLLNEYVKRIFENINPKMIEEEYIFKNELSIYISKYIEIFNSNKINPKSMIEINCELYNIKLRDELIKVYLFYYRNLKIK